MESFCTILSSRKLTPPLRSGGVSLRKRGTEGSWSSEPEDISPDEEYLMPREEKIPDFGPNYGALLAAGGIRRLQPCDRRCRAARRLAGSHAPAVHGLLAASPPRALRRGPEQGFLRERQITIPAGLMSPVPPEKTSVPRGRPANGTKATNRICEYRIPASSIFAAAFYLSHSMI